MVFLTFLAVLPGIVIMVKVYRMDKIEKEPTPLMLLLLLFGALVCIPVALVEGVLDSALQAIMSGGSLYNLIDNFLCVALIEECGKYYVLKKCTWRSKSFDYRFDAIVYAVAATLGFAILENILYVMDGGVQVAIVRGLLSVPGHVVFGIFMGLAYGEAKIMERRGDYMNTRRQLRLAVIVPTILHGIYDFCLSEETVGAIVIFYVFVIVLYVYAWKKINKAAREDSELE